MPILGHDLPRPNQMCFAFPVLVQTSISHYTHISENGITSPQSNQHSNNRRATVNFNSLCEELNWTANSCSDPEIWSTFTAINSGSANI